MQKGSFLFQEYFCYFFGHSWFDISFPQWLQFCRNLNILNLHWQVSLISNLTVMCITGTCFCQCFSLSEIDRNKCLFVTCTCIYESSNNIQTTKTFLHLPVHFLCHNDTVTSSMMLFMLMDCERSHLLATRRIILATRSMTI